MNEAERVPATAAIVTVSEWLPPLPAERRQMAEVSDAQADVLQLLSPTDDVGVLSFAPKLSPDTVKLNPALVTPLSLDVKLTIGARLKKAAHSTTARFGGSPQSKSQIFGNRVHRRS